MSNDTPQGDRIAKVLSRAGVASRRDAERMITEGRVSVNGKVITSPALNVTDADRIVVDGKAMRAPDAPRIWLCDNRARRKGPPNGLCVFARRHATGDVGRSAGPEFRRLVVVDQ